MKVGLITPQGWKMEYEGWDPAEAWANTVELARQADELVRRKDWASNPCGPSTTSPRCPSPPTR